MKWKTNTSIFCDTMNEINPAIVNTGKARLNKPSICGCAQSDASGLNHNEKWVTIKKDNCVKKPINTAVIAAFFPYFSLNKSVAKKIPLNIVFPSVVTIPKIVVVLATWIFAAITLIVMYAYNPFRPNNL